MDPHPGSLEYNTSIDITAAQVVFDDSDLVVWQVPRDVYRKATTSQAELEMRMATTGPLGQYLYDKLAALTEQFDGFGFDPGETWALGDSPLVTLTALQSFEPIPSSSNAILRPCPRLKVDGSYEPRVDGRPLQIFTHIDFRLTFEDLFAKLARHEVDPR